MRAPGRQHENLRLLPRTIPAPPGGPAVLHYARQKLPAAVPSEPAGPPRHHRRRHPTGGWRLVRHRSFPEIAQCAPWGSVRFGGWLASGREITGYLVASGTHTQHFGKLIPLCDWAGQVFAPPPAIRTLRAWVKTGQIQPAPVKVGREWRVYELAQYVPLGSPPTQGITDPVILEILKSGQAA